MADEYTIPKLATLAVILTALVALGASVWEDDDRGCGTDAECVALFGGSGDPEPVEQAKASSGPLVSGRVSTSHPAYTVNTAGELRVTPGRKAADIRGYIGAIPPGGSIGSR